MKNRIFGFFAVVALMMTACVEENNLQPEQGAQTLITAGFEQTKTTLQEDGKVLWTNGDMIVVNGSYSNELALEASAPVAVFEFEDVVEMPYSAIFPASIYMDETTVVLPDVQTYAEGTFHSEASPMAAYLAEEGRLSFKHLASVVKINITKAEDLDNIASVEFFGNNGEQISGEFTVDYQSATLTPASGYAADKAVKVEVNQPIEGEGLSVYVVVPAGEYANGFTVRVMDVNNDYMEVSKASAMTLVAGTVYDMPAFAFEPAYTYAKADVLIKSVDDFIQYVMDYNAGNIDPTSSAALACDLVFDAETSARFCQTGGITKFDEGKFNGNGKSIKNLTSTVAIFKKSSSSKSVVENLTVDASCTFNRTLSKGDTDNGTLFDFAQKGTFTNIKVAATLNVMPEEWYRDGNEYLGGIASSSQTGVFTNCEFSGKIVVPADFALKCHRIFVGGLVGQYTRYKDNAIKNCTFSGSIEYAAKMGTLHNPLVYIGGFSGAVSGTVSGDAENMNLMAGEINVSNAEYYEDAGYPGRNVAYYVGGFAGALMQYKTNCNSISYVKNTGNVTFNHTNTVFPLVNTYIGGVLGANEVPENELKNCVNEGNVTFNVAENATPYSNVYVGGVLGASSLKTTVSGCVNNGVVTVPSTGFESSYYGSVYGFLSDDSVFEGNN